MKVLRKLGTMVLILVLTVVLALAGRCNIAAEGQAVEVDGALWNDFFESIPPDSAELLPEGALEDSESFGEAVEEMSGAEYLTGEIARALGIELDGALKLACGICAILVLGAVFSSAGASLGNGALGSAVRFCSSGALFVTVVYAQYSHFEAIERFFSSVSTLMEGMVPITASAWAMGGNVSTAATGSASFYLALGICNKLFAKSIIPVAAIMSILGLCDAMSDEMRTGRLLAAIKKIYGFFLGLIMTVLLSSMSAQTAISSAADSTTARTARLVSGSVIPVLGGGVGETLRTVAGGVTYLKSVIGIGGIIMIFLLLLPVGLSVLLTRFVFLITGGLADILGCPSEARLLENLGEVYGCMLAVISGVAITFILALCIFTQTVVAVA
jgi:stage III sporulation protein AE